MFTAEEHSVLLLVNVTGHILDVVARGERGILMSTMNVAVAVIHTTQDKMSEFLI